MTIEDAKPNAVIGLRIDVDTYRGTKLGVPNLCRALDKHGIQATFFFSAGPDNMGRHLLRLLRPAFFWKMVRTRAGSLYGWDILLRGAFWPGPVIGRRLAPAIAAAAAAGHEIGLHAWDHHEWQAKIDTMNEDAIAERIQKGCALLESIIGRPIASSAAPGWRCTDAVLLSKDRFGFDYNSDCRGTSIFRPLVRGKLLKHVQIPTTMPTYDEVVGRNGITMENYNGYLFSKVDPRGLNVLTIHAEAEGIVGLENFRKFLDEAQRRSIALKPLGALLRSGEDFPAGRIAARELPGREGWLACQEAV